MAKCNLGMCYEHGWGVAQDSGKAVEWFTKAAEQGLAVGQFHLGISYERGMRGVAQDRGKAVEWYTKAADQGHADAQLSLDRFGLDR